MGWIEDQIKLRVELDDAAFENACKDVSAIIMNKQIEVVGDERLKINSAIDKILSFYNMKSRELPSEVKGFDDQIEYLCRPCGVMHRRVKLEGKWYKDAIGAMLTKWKNGDVVALLPGRWSGYVYYDPIKDKRVKLNKKNAELLDENAICFYRPLPLRKISIIDLSMFVKKCCRPSAIVKTLLVMMIVTFVGMLTPYITQRLFSDVLPSGSKRMLLGIAILSVCAGISTMLLQAVRKLVMETINTTIDVSVEAATIARILSLPSAFFRKYSAGEITSRATQVNSLCQTLVSVVFSTSLTSLFSLIYLSQVLKYAPALVIPSVSITVLTIIVSIFATRKQIQLNRGMMRTAAKNNGMVYSMISGIQKIKLSGSEKRSFARWLNLYTEEAMWTYNYNLPSFLLCFGVYNIAITLIGNVILYYLAVKSRVTVADYYAFTAAYGMVSGAFTALGNIISSIASIIPTIEMAKPIMDSVPEVSENKLTVTKLIGGVELNNVSFRYTDSMPLVLDNLSLRIRPGEYMAIIGKTGCGKSTLVRLLLGFETPQKGAIYYDGKDMTSVDLKSLRQKIGVVMQNDKLLQGDIYSNIVISAPWLTIDEAWEAAEIAGIADDIRAMPMGMHTMITEGSGGISGGQRQRLMIARAIAPKPRILIFDEATSALDNITQKQVSEALDKIRCTRIVIAHRLSTIKQCDRIVVLDHGNIAETGTYEELIEQDGLFAELVARQRIEI